MNADTKLPSFKPQLPVKEDTNGAITILTMRPTVYGRMPMDLTIRLDAGTYAIMIDRGCNLLGARAGHVVLAHPDCLPSVGRIHSMLSGADDGPKCLYRDGDPTNLTVANLGVITRAGYDWWLIPEPGELDHGWSTRGRPFRPPGFISRRRPLAIGPRPDGKPRAIVH